VHGAVHTFAEIEKGCRLFWEFSMSVAVSCAGNRVTSEAERCPLPQLSCSNGLFRELWEAFRELSEAFQELQNASEPRAVRSPPKVSESSRKLCLGRCPSILRKGLLDPQQWFPRFPFFVHDQMRRSYVFENSKSGVHCQTCCSRDLWMNFDLARRGMG